MTTLCLTLSFPAALDERVFDTLLSIPQVGLFTSTAGALHGLAPARLNAREQVRGYAAITQVQAFVAEADLDDVLAQLDGVRWWVTPVLAAGEIA